MTAITIDTYALITSLKEAGVPEQQAKAQIDAIAKFVDASVEHAKHEYRLDDITTNKDLDARIKETELKIEVVRADLMREVEKSKNQLIMWVVSSGMAQVGAIIYILKILGKT